jgi:transposase
VEASAEGFGGVNGDVHKSETIRSTMLVTEARRVGLELKLEELTAVRHVSSKPYEAGRRANQIKSSPKTPRPETLTEPWRQLLAGLGGVWQGRLSCSRRQERLTGVRQSPVRADHNRARRRAPPDLFAAGSGCLPRDSNGLWPQKRGWRKTGRERADSNESAMQVPN